MRVLRPAFVNASLVQTLHVSTRLCLPFYQADPVQANSAGTEAGQNSGTLQPSPRLADDPSQAVVVP